MVQSENKKKILICDDSALMRRLESDIINSDERFTVIGTCNNGLEAYDTVTRNADAIDVVLIDVNMPKMTGLEFLAAISKFNLKVKVIIISTLVSVDSKEAIKALELGAFECIQKPENFAEVMGEGFKKKVLSTVALAANKVEFSLFSKSSSVPVGTASRTPIAPKPPAPGGAATVTGTTGTTGTTRSSIPVRTPATASNETAEGRKVVSPMNAREILANITTPRKPHKQVDTQKRLVLIASSTGGPKALQEVIPKLPANINAPILIVQHMAEGFTKSLAMRLDSESQIKVVEAATGDVISKGVCYLAQGGGQMRLKKVGSDYVIDVNTEEPPRNALKPCADILFESIAGMDFEDITCCVMTGMGGDGTMGIHYLTQKNNCYVIAQDEPTSTVYGMPKVVYEAGLTDSVKPLSELAQEIIKNTGVHK